jgi:DNA-binding IclR family transcriptional regulator
MREVNRYVIAGGVKTLAVLEALDDATATGGGVSAADIARATKLTANCAFRALKTLEAAGYAKRDAAGWKMTARAARFSDRIFNATERKTASPVINILPEK